MKVVSEKHSWSTRVTPPINPLTTYHWLLSFLVFSLCFIVWMGLGFNLLHYNVENGHSLMSTLTNGDSRVFSGSQCPVFPGNPPIQVLTEVDVPQLQWTSHWGGLGRHCEPLLGICNPTVGGILSIIFSLSQNMDKFSSWVMDSLPSRKPTNYRTWRKNQCYRKNIKLIFDLWQRCFHPITDRLI